MSHQIPIVNPQNLVLEKIRIKKMKNTQQMVCKVIPSVKYLMRLSFFFLHVYSPLLRLRSFPHQWVR
jgi:uncharacterized membrane protein YwzB